MGGMTVNGKLERMNVFIGNYFESIMTVRRANRVIGSKLATRIGLNDQPFALSTEMFMACFNCLIYEDGDDW